MSGFNLAQTFFVDPDAAQQAPSVYITSIDLYFADKPVEGKTSSGISKPGVTLFIGDTTTDNAPNINSYKQDVFARVEYDNISTSTTGATATTFTFSRPINIRTNTTAAFLVKFDGSDAGFQLWYNKAGSLELGTTNVTTVTSGKVDGSLFVITNGSSLTPQKDADLSFKLKVAKFTTTATTYKIKNRPYEILKTSNTVGSFLGGEPVYVLAANAAGTISISSSSTSLVGTGTTFTPALSAGDSFVITDGTPGNTDIRKVVSVTNTTLMVIDAAPSFTNTSGHFYKTVTGKAYFSSGQTDHLVIQDSTANSTVYLSVGNTVYGVDSLAYASVANIENYTVNAVTPGFVVGVPPGTSINTSIGFANSSLAYSGTTAQDAPISVRLPIDSYKPVLASRTTEVTTATAFTSLQSTLKFTTINPYVTPYVDQENLDMFVESYSINNDDTNEYLGRGNAETRWISRTVNMEANQLAEDLIVYLSAYKPANTTIKVYAAFRNTTDIESMDIKNWTELTANTVGVLNSSISDKSDFIDFEYGVPFQPTGTKQAGSFTTVYQNTVITGTSANVSGGVIAGDVIRLYSPFASNTYFIATVTASNTTTFTVAAAPTLYVANSIMLGSGWSVDVTSRKNSAFLDARNNNILTYYNSALSQFQGYNSFAIKIVLLSDGGYVVPLVSDIRAVAISA